MQPETNSTSKQEGRTRRYLLESGALERPHPLAKVAERLGRSPGRSPLPDLFEQFLRDQMERDRLPPPSASALLPSRGVVKGRRRGCLRRPDC